jgi:hydroxypyruvate reductase
MPLDPLTRDAMSIWQAGVAAVDSRNLVRRNVAVRGDAIEIAGERLPLVPSSRLIVVGAGKAGAGMAAPAHPALWPLWRSPEATLGRKM